MAQTHRSENRADEKPAVAQQELDTDQLLDRGFRFLDRSMQHPKPPNQPNPSTNEHPVPGPGPGPRSPVRVPKARRFEAKLRCQL